jgi:glycosyltransferase involved in cell wall biosynthesis
MTLVSVLMSVHNGARTVSAAVDSIRAQTFPDWELLLVDDASTDGTAELLTRLDDPRIRVLRNERNRGLAASLNRAFRESRGTLIARMDADDVALPQRFAAQVAFLASHPEVDILGSAAILLDGSGREAGISTRRETHGDIAASICKENPFIHPAVMMRRRVLEELGGYDESLRRAQDYDLWLRGVHRFRYHNLQEPLLRYSKPARATWISSSYGARVILKNRGLRGAWWAARLLAAFALSKLR